MIRLSILMGVLGLFSCKSVHMTAIVSGRITDQYGDPISEVVIMIEKSSGNHIDIGMLNNDDGTYALKDVPAGSCAILFNAEGYSPKSVSLYLEPNENRRLDVILE